MRRRYGAVPTDTSESGNRPHAPDHARAGRQRVIVGYCESSQVSLARDGSLSWDSQVSTGQRVQLPPERAGYDARLDAARSSSVAASCLVYGTVVDEEMMCGMLGLRGGSSEAAQRQLKKIAADEFSSAAVPVFVSYDRDATRRQRLSPVTRAPLVLALHLVARDRHGAGSTRRRLGAARTWHRPAPASACRR